MTRREQPKTAPNTPLEFQNQPANTRTGRLFAIAAVRAVNECDRVF